MKYRRNQNALAVYYERKQPCFIPGETTQRLNMSLQSMSITVNIVFTKRP